jgi:hypothetical protein
MNQGGSRPACEVSLRLRRLQGSMQSRNLRPASHKLRVQKRKLRPHVNLKFLDSQLNPIVGSNLFRLACLHSVEIGKDYIRQQANERGTGIVHEQILMTFPQDRMITIGGRW